MSCINPRIIKNPIRSFLPGVDKPTLEIPCGGCEGCLKDKQSEWWMRSRYEILDCIRKGGRVFFPTFTYSERCLPRFYWRDKNGKLCSFPCFNHRDKDKYLNHIRKIFERKGITEGFKYIWASEYGETQTHRSHYHALFFFDSRFNCYSDAELESIIRDNWYYGRVDGNDELGMKVNPVFKDKAAGYVSKYTTKNLDWYEQPALSKYLAEKGTEVLKKIKHLMPKRFNSQGFGIGLVDEVVNKVNNRDYVYFEKGIQLFMSDGNVKSFNLPRYIFDKVCYRKDKETGFKELTEIGKSVKSHMYGKSIKSLATNMQLSSLELNLRSKFSDEDVQGLCPIDRDQNISSLVDYIKELMNGRSFVQLAVYKTVFRDQINYDGDDIYSHFTDDDTFVSYGLDVLKRRNEASIDDRLGQDFTDKGFFPSLHERIQGVLLKRRYNNHPCFENFDLVLSLFNTLSLITNKRNISVQHEKELKLKEAKIALKERKNALLGLSRRDIENLYKKVV